MYSGVGAVEILVTQFKTAFGNSGFVGISLTFCLFITWVFS